MKHILYLFYTFIHLHPTYTLSIISSIPVKTAHNLKQHSMTESSEFDVEAQMMRSHNIQQFEINNLSSKLMNNIKTVIICSSVLLFVIVMTTIGNAHFHPFFAINPDHRSILMHHTPPSVTLDLTSFNYAIYKSALINSGESHHFQSAKFLDSDLSRVSEQNSMEFGIWLMTQYHDPFESGDRNDSDDVIEQEIGAGVVQINSDAVIVSIWVASNEIEQADYAIEFDEEFRSELTVITSDASNSDALSAELGKETSQRLHHFLSSFAEQNSVAILFDKIAIYQGGLIAEAYSQNIQLQTVAESLEIQASGGIQTENWTWKRKAGESCTSLNWCVKSKCVDRIYQQACNCWKKKLKLCSCFCMSEEHSNSIAV